MQRVKASTPGETALVPEQWRTRPHGAGLPPGVKHADTAPSGAFYTDPEEAELAAAAAAARHQRGETAPPGSSPGLSWLVGPEKLSFAEDKRFKVDARLVVQDAEGGSGVVTLPQGNLPTERHPSRTERQGAVPPASVQAAAAESGGGMADQASPVSPRSAASQRGSGEYRRHDPYQTPQGPPVLNNSIVGGKSS
eukprot:Hpha_TRINITY_DN17297_c0_g1::TRINITY_DN17297_c0_g1_i1::g.17921::m.17921